MSLNAEKLEAWAVSLSDFKYVSCYLSPCRRAVKVLEVLRPFISLLPEVSKPERKVRVFILP